MVMDSKAERNGFLSAVLNTVFAKTEKKNIVHVIWCSLVLQNYEGEVLEIKPRRAEICTLDPKLRTSSYKMDDWEIERNAAHFSSAALALKWIGTWKVVRIQGFRYLIRDEKWSGHEAVYLWASLGRFLVVLNGFEIDDSQEKCKAFHGSRKQELPRKRGG